MKLATVLMCATTLAASSHAIAQAPAAADEIDPEITLPETIKKALDRAGSELVLHPDGRKELRFNGGHRHVMMMRIGEDGSVETFCAADEAGAVEFFSKPDRDEESQ